MASLGQFVRNWLLPDKSLVVFCLLLLTAVWSAASWQIALDRQETVEALRNDGDKVSRAFEEHVRAVLLMNERYLLIMESEFRRANAVTPAITSLLRHLGSEAPIVEAVIADAGGYAIASTLPVPPGMNFSTAPYFAVHKAANTGETYISEPFAEWVTKAPMLHLSRRINGTDGDFAGVAVVALDPYYFSQFYRQLNFSADYTVRLVGLDGVIRASNSLEEMGYNFSGASLFGEAAKQPAGFYYAPGTQFGKRGYMSYRVMTDFPLIVQVGLADRALAPLAQRRGMYLAAAGGMSVFIIWFTARLLIRSRKQRLADLALQSSYGQLTAIHEELSANEEELRTSYNALINERAFSSAVLESVPGLLYLYDEEGRMVRWNKNHETATGYSAEELARMTLADWYRYDAKTVERIYGAAGRAFQEGASSAESYLQNKDGSKTPYYFTAVKTVIDNKPYIVGIGIDIAERIKMETALVEKERELQRSLEELTASHGQLAASEERLRKLYTEVVAANELLEHSRQTAEEIFQAAGDGFVVLDGESGDILAVNRRLTEMFGYTQEELKEQGLVLLATPAKLEMTFAIIRRAVTEGPQPLVENETLDRHGNRLIVEISAGPVTIDGKTRCLALLRDVTVRRQLEEGLEFLRMRDPLTGVYNRAFFETDMLRVQVAESGELGMFVCDVDGLKLINDTLGHLQGDELLRKVAAILEAGAQRPDYVARIGGDEFAVILFSPTKKRMEELDQYYRRAVEAYNKESPHLPLSLSLGWAIGASSTATEVIFKEADNNMYRQKLHQSQSVRGSIVQTMMKALEERDHITEGHADRLGELMEKMGHTLELPRGTIADLRLLAKFHDIGKVGIPDSILNKPGRLDEEELAIMRRHCEIGYRIAKASPDLEPIAGWILKHQEWWNGRGYPLGIAGESIPLECRILSIADAYDAMTNDRPYRRAMPPDQALAELKRCAGTQFDPRLVELFVALAEAEGGL